MDLTLNDEQRQMRSAARDAFEARGGIELARRQLSGDDTAVTESWELLSEMDYTATTVPLDYGGLGEGMDYLTLLLEEVGRFALPAPFPETTAFAAPLIANLGTDDQRERLLPPIADGESMVSLALYDDEQTELPDGVSMAANPVDGGYRLSGTKTLVPYGDAVDHLVVAARTPTGQSEGGISLFVVDATAVTTTRLDSLDQTRPLSAVDFDGVEVSDDAMLGAPGESTDALRRAIDRFQIATCAMLVGAAERAVELSVEHGKTREQYGHPIGRFQAVKHRIADMWGDAEQARELTRYAAWAVTNEAEDAERAVSAAAAFCGRRCPRIFGDDIKNHGGQGFTWDHDGHIYLKQAKSWANFLGGPADHHERVADELDF
jgi:alkylation response protein AidB-like acyl-CoA dehydrogenase